MLRISVAVAVDAFCAHTSSGCENAETNGVEEITLSYTFYPVAEDETPASTGAG